MHLTLRDEQGRMLEGLALAISPSSLRIILRHTNALPKASELAKANDTLELKRINCRWTTERGETLEIESMIQEPSVQTASFFSGFVLPASASWN